MMAALQSLVVSLLFTLGSCQLTGDTPWDTLNTTFPYFFSVPLTQSDAIAKGWSLILQCGDTDSPGNVYIYEDDLSSMPIFNADGNIAGIIVGLDDPGETQHGRAPWMYYSAYNDSNYTFYGIEGIFRDPTTICDTGSTGDIAFGDRLWIANGSHSAYSEVPLTRSTDADVCYLDEAGWDEGGCKDGAFKMGVHYWRYNSVDLDCDDAYPIFILYDNDILHAWGVAMANTDRPYANSSRWEHPQGSFLTSFFLDGEAPTCLAEQEDAYNSLHVYMTSSVLNHTTTCPDTSINVTAIDCNDLNTSGSSGEEDDVVWIIVVAVAFVLLVVIGVFAYCKYCKTAKESDAYLLQN